MTQPPQYITSRDNPTLKLVKRLAQDNTAYRKEGKLWIEGEHLCSAALARGVKPLSRRPYSSAYFCSRKLAMTTTSSCHHREVHDPLSPARVRKSVNRSPGAWVVCRC